MVGVTRSRIGSSCRRSSRSILTTSGGGLHCPDSELQSSDRVDDDDDRGTGAGAFRVDNCILSPESQEATLTSSAGLTVHKQQHIHRHAHSPNSINYFHYYLHLMVIFQVVSWFPSGSPPAPVPQPNLWTLVEWFLYGSDVLLPIQPAS